jgi:hypothetical protein
MFRPTLLSACALIVSTCFAFAGCKSNQQSSASKPSTQPSNNAYAQQHNSKMPPAPARTAARPRLLPGGPTAPLTPPPARRGTSPTSSSSPRSGPSLPLPAPPAEDF